MNVFCNQCTEALLVGVVVYVAVVDDVRKPLRACWLLVRLFLIAMPIRIVGVTFAVVLLLFCACTAAVCGALRLVYIFLLNGHNCKNL